MLGFSSVPGYIINGNIPKLRKLICLGPYVELRP